MHDLVHLPARLKKQKRRERINDLLAIAAFAVIFATLLIVSVII